MKMMLETKQVAVDFMVPGPSPRIAFLPGEILSIRSTKYRPSKYFPRRCPVLLLLY
jgi:hypothetical protein